MSRCSWCNAPNLDTSACFNAEDLCTSCCGCERDPIDWSFYVSIIGYTLAFAAIFLRGYGTAILLGIATTFLVMRLDRRDYSRAYWKRS